MCLTSTMISTMASLPSSMAPLPSSRWSRAPLPPLAPSLTRANYPRLALEAERLHLEGLAEATAAFVLANNLSWQPLLALPMVMGAIERRCREAMEVMAMTGNSIIQRRAAILPAMADPTTLVEAMRQKL